MAEAESGKAPMMTVTKPQKEHAWLQRLLGKWEYEGEAMMPGQRPEKHSGTETVRALGEFWTVREAEADIPGGMKARTLIVLGYDPGKGRFIGSFVDSTSPTMWIYEGELDEDEKMLSLTVEGPSMTDSAKTSLYRDSVEVRDGDHHVFTSEVLDEDGNWHLMMTSDYRRRSPGR